MLDIPLSFFFCSFVTAEERDAEVLPSSSAIASEQLLVRELNPPIVGW
jgi:hypothetical protein